MVRFSLSHNTSTTILQPYTPLQNVALHYPHCVPHVPSPILPTKPSLTATVLSQPQRNITPPPQSHAQPSYPPKKSARPA
ncbi:unnamed protein product [Fusarium graminearum]|nr:unnamed protein product [Fusarium graminearum]